MSDAALTAALALLAAFLFALGVQFLNRGLAHADPQTGSMIDIGASAALQWLLAPFLLVEIAWHTAPCSGRLRASLTALSRR